MQHSFTLNGDLNTWTAKKLYITCRARRKCAAAL